MSKGYSKELVVVKTEGSCQRCENEGERQDPEGDAEEKGEPLRP